MSHVSKPEQSSPTPSSSMARQLEAQQDMDKSMLRQTSSREAIKNVWNNLSILDRLLTPLIVVAMILGVVIGQFAPGAQENLSRGNWNGVSIPLVVGLLVMMWPILSKVKYEELPQMCRTRQFLIQVAMSLVLNWIVGPFLMLALAWATLPDLEGYRTGIIIVGIARCIAMVMIWSELAKGDTNMCAMIVIVNSVLQIVLFAPMALFFINVISGSTDFQLSYAQTASAVGIYLGIPLAAGLVTRLLGIRLMGKQAFEQRFLPLFGKLSLIGLLYVIIVIFAEQAQHILDNLGPVFRTMVPLVLYFAILWSATFVLVWRLGRRYGDAVFNYKMAVVQAFTAGSNNFELAIAVAVAVYGAESDQALAATIGPLVEVPVLVLLTWVSLFLGERLLWGRSDRPSNAELEKTER